MIPATQGSLSIWGQLKEAAVPVALYWVALLYAFGVFAAVVAFTDGAKGSFDTSDVVILVCLALSTFAGAAIGQGLAFLRVRTWIVMLFGAGCWFVAFVLLASLASMAGEIGALVFLVLFLVPIALTGGLWSLETHRALWSLWLPFLYATAAVIIWAEWRNTDDNWFAGDKWAIWDLVTLGVLGGIIGLALLYLVTRETHRLALWRRGPTAPLKPTTEERGAARPRLTILGLVLLMGTAVVLTGATAIVSPYLWRTGPGDREGDGEGGEPQEQREGQSSGEPTPAEGGGDGKMMKQLKQVAEKAVEAAKTAGSAVCMMLTLAILALLGVLIAYRPLKRLATVRHLRDPLWQVSPTTRIEQGWRLVEIAMGDVGVFPHPGEDAAGLARRARPVLDALSPVEVHGLEDAAEVADRVRFGLGVGPDDVLTMQRFSAWALDTVWERIGDREQVRCMYRAL